MEAGTREVIEQRSNEVEPLIGHFVTRVGTFDRGIIAETWEGLFYTKHPAFVIRPFDIVLDIGAHIGAFALYAAKKGAMVRAYEPERENYELLLEQMTVHNPEAGRNVQCASLAVTGDGRDVKLIPCSEGANTGGGWTDRQDGEGADHEGVSTPSTTLNSIAADLQKIDFLKMDCEGAEYEILMQASEETIAKIKKIAMEWHGGRAAFDELRAFLKERGFNEEFHGTEAMGNAYFWR